MEDVSRVGPGRAQPGRLGRFVRYWLPPLAVYALITYVSSIPGQKFPSVPVWNIDKAVHLVEYAPFGAFLARALIRTTPLSPWAVLVATTALSFGAGMLDEYHQRFVPNRMYDLRDAAADTVGGALGALAMLLFLRWRDAGRQRARYAVRPR
jgi:VanZ family protein